MFELGVVLLLDCITKVGSDSLEETLANVPACSHMFHSPSLHLLVWVGVVSSTVGL
jgi:hypothetical protein